MGLYPAELTLREARDRYFEINHFENGGYDEAWVKMKAGPIPIAFPNTKSRVRSVKLHDLHHVLTEYPTTWTGEAEIGAWEISTGCADHYPAWVLNFYAYAIGLVIAPENTYRAFMRGRRSANLYRRVYDEALLARTVGSMRRELHLEAESREASLKDKLGFVFWSLMSGGAYLLTAMLLLLPLIIVVWLILR